MARGFVCGRSCASPTPPQDGFFIYLFSHTFTFQLLDKPWSQMSSLLPPGSCLEFLSRTGFINPTARRFFIECLANSRSRAFWKSICAQKKFQRIYTSMHSAGLELTKLTYTRLEDNLIRHRGDRLPRTEMVFRLAISTEPDPQGSSRVDIKTHPYTAVACAAGVVTVTAGRHSSRCHREN